MILAEITALNDAALLLFVPVALLLYGPIFYLSGRKASLTSQLVALLLALLLLVLDRWAAIPFVPLRLLVFYLPLAVVLYKIVRNSNPSTPS